MMQLTGCINGNNKAMNVGSTEDDCEELFISQRPSIFSEGQFSFGVKNHSTKTSTYEYDGEDIHIPYYIQNDDKKNKTELGLLFLVNGVLQLFKIEYNDGTIEEETIMHRFALKCAERKEFDIVFKPQSGKKGERIAFIPAIICEPNYLPESEERPKYGNFLHMCANIPFELKLNANVTECYKGGALLNEQDLTQKILEEQKKIHHSNSLDSLDSTPKLIIYNPEDQGSDVIYFSGNKAKLGVEIFGGADVSQRITIFVNNKPVKVNGKDYISVKTQKGKMYQANVELELEDYEKLNSIYAVTMTDGEDYCVQDIYQSRVKLLAER